MKIAVVLNTSWNIYNFRKGLITSMIDKGNQVITIAPKDHFTSKLEEMGCQHIPVKMDSRGANPIKDFALSSSVMSVTANVENCPASSVNETGCPL